MAKRRVNESSGPQILPSAVQLVEDRERHPAIADEPAAKLNGNHSAATQSTDEIITMSDAARALNKSPQTIKRWILDGLLNAIRMPTGIFGLRRSELNKFLGGSALPQKEIK